MILDGVLDIVLLLAVLVALVVIHELGHFLVARRANVKVHEFGIGFPPRAAVFHRGRETLYTLNWLPIGGFVRLEGEEGESADPRAFVNQSLRTRLAILLAGVLMNFLLAWLIFTLIAGLADPVANIRVANVSPGSPAAIAGLQGGQQIDETPDGDPIYDESGDLITAIDGRRFAIFERPDVSDMPLAYLRSRAGEEVTLTLRRPDGSVYDVAVQLRPPSEIANGVLGIQVQRLPLDDIQRSPTDAIAIGFKRTIDAATLILRGLGDFITNITNPPVQGPIGMVNTVGIVRTELPPVFFVWLIAVLSANLAVVNALPFPPMDGGRVAMSVLKHFTGRRISPALERSVYLAGFMALMALLVWITYFDIRRLGGG
jgi:regulator of sigma E protease